MARWDCLLAAGGISALLLVSCATTDSADVLREPELLVSLPEYCPTPDGMAVAPNGDLVVACPNYATFDKDTGKLTTPACIIRVDQDLLFMGFDLNRYDFITKTSGRSGHTCPLM